MDGRVYVCIGFLTTDNKLQHVTTNIKMERVVTSVGPFRKLGFIL